MKQQNPVDRIYKRVSFVAQRVAVAAAITGVMGIYGWKIWNKLEEWKKDAQSQSVTHKNEPGKSNTLPATR
ncbi:MAG: hypothetical protein JNL51_16695 [Chitinophagaceae bacterium]|nr:hypothetical protein [Chitinophagaceae bacterium]